MKTLDLCALMTIHFVCIYWCVLKLFVSYHCWTKFWWQQKWNFSYRTPLFNCLHDAFGQLYEPLLL